MDQEEYQEEHPEDRLEERPEELPEERRKPWEIIHFDIRIWSVSADYICEV